MSNILTEAQLAELKQLVEEELTKPGRDKKKGLNHAIAKATKRFELRHPKKVKVAVSL